MKKGIDNFLDWIEQNDLSAKFWFTLGVLTSVLIFTVEFFFYERP